MKHDFTTGSVWKNLLFFVIPIFGANVLQAIYGTVDLLVVGLFTDASAVSAVSTGSMTMQTLTGIITGLTMGCAVLLGQYIGMKDEERAGKTVASAFRLFVTVGILLAILVVLGAGIIFIVLFNALGGMFRGIGDSRTPLLLMGIACVTNIACDLLLVGAFHMGAAGAAIATVAAQALSVVCAFVRMKKKLLKS